MSWSVIEIDESGRVTIRRGGTLTGETEVEPEPEPELVTSWRECVRNHPWKIDDKPEHCDPIETEPETEPEPDPEPEPKPKLVTWRRCVRILPAESSNLSFYDKWYPSGDIPKHWYPIEANTQPIETVKQLPEGQEP